MAVDTDVVPDLCDFTVASDQNRGANNTFEGSAVLESCQQWYDTFYERNFDLQFAERVKQLEKSILNVEKDIFSSQKMTELSA